MIAPSDRTAQVPSRLEGVDIARALALLSMLDAHAFDGWVAASGRASIGFQVTRVLATLALPGFLLLVGSSLALRASAHLARGRPVHELRAALARRGLGLFAGGYGLSAAYALVDGGLRTDTLLRADILHAIGLSLALVAWLALSPPREGASFDARLLALRSMWIGAVLVLGSPWLSRLGAHVGGPWRYALAPLIDVPGVTRMPLVPLGFFVAAGVPLGLRLAAHASGGRGSSALALHRLLPYGAAASLIGWSAQRVLLAAFDMGAARNNLAIIPNAIDLFGRAALLLALGLWLEQRLPARVRDIGVALGRRSLLIYALHLPLCYGRLARPLAHRLTMAEAALAFIALVLACAALARGAERLRERD